MWIGTIGGRLWTVDSREFPQDKERPSLFSFALEQCTAQLFLPPLVVQLIPTAASAAAAAASRVQTKRRPNPAMLMPKNGLLDSFFLLPDATDEPLVTCTCQSL
jgi:hypothetical protein